MNEVAVAIATYNGARFLPELLASLARQTRRPDQVVVSDDASTDETLKIVRSFATTSGIPTKLVGNADSPGVWGNFYSAFNATDCKIIFYADQDDVWHPSKLERVASEFADPTVRLVVHSSRVCDQHLRPTGQIVVANSRYGKFAFPADSLNVHGFGHQMAFDRVTLDLLNKLRPLGRNNFDTFIPAVASFLGSVVVLADPLVDFRRHDNSVTSAGKQPADLRHEPKAERLTKWLRTSYVRIAKQHHSARPFLPKEEWSAYHGPLQRSLLATRLARSALLQTRIRRLTAVASLGRLVASPGATFSNERPLYRLAVGALSLLSRAASGRAG